MIKDMRRVEMLIAMDDGMTGQSGEWYTDWVLIPKDTPDSEIEKAGRTAMLAKINADEEGMIVAGILLYNENDEHDLLEPDYVEYCEVQNSDGKIEGYLKAAESIAVGIWHEDVAEADSVHGAYVKSENDSHDPKLVAIAETGSMLEFFAAFIESKIHIPITVIDGFDGRLEYTVAECT